MSDSVREWDPSGPWVLWVLSSGYDAGWQPVSGPSIEALVRWITAAPPCDGWVLTPAPVRRWETLGPGPGESPV